VFAQPGELYRWEIDVDEYSDNFGDMQSPIDPFLSSFYNQRQRPTFSDFKPKMDDKKDTSAKLNDE
jgi:hypothetical protein